MNLKQLVDQFDLVTDTEEGLEQFRNLILRLAFRGELTKQDLDDKSGKELLEQVKEEKQRMYDNGEIRKPTELSDIKEDEMPFKLPANWIWCRLGNVYHNWGNKNPDKDFQYIDVGSINNEKGEIGNEIEVISPEGAPSRAKRIVKEGTVLYSTVRPYLLNVAIYDGSFEYEPIASTAFEVIHPIEGVFNKYIYHYLRSPIFTEYVDSTMVGVAYPAVNKGDMIEGYFPLPPFEEQQRIVKKIETLFSQVDELEQKVRQDQEVDERLQIAVLDDLQRAETPEASRQSWQRLTNHFEQIYRKPEHIDQLKQAILNEAVRGRLVPQDPNDEPAEKLLERIKEEKQRLYEESEIRKPKDLDPISDEEIPYQIPKGWCWERLGNLVILERGRSKHRPRNADKLFKNGTYPFIQTGDVANSNGQITEYSKKYNEVGLKQSKLWSKGTLCITIAANIADTGILGFDACFPDSVVGLLPVISPDETVKYYDFFIQNLQSDLEEFAPSTAQKNINLTILNSLLCPLPPLEEQIRIVEKVRKLFAWCDDLKEKLNRSQQTDQRLLEALVNEVK